MERTDFPGKKKGGFRGKEACERCSRPPSTEDCSKENEEDCGGTRRTNVQGHKHIDRDKEESFKSGEKIQTCGSPLAFSILLDFLAYPIVSVLSGELCHFLSRGFAVNSSSMKIRKSGRVARWTIFLARKIAFRRDV